MKRLIPLLLLLCLLLSACGHRSDALIVEVQREATFAIDPIPETTIPITLPTEPATVPTELPTQAPTEPSTEAPAEEPTEASSSIGQNYVLNKNTKKFHYPYCGSVKQMKEKNRQDFYGTREKVLAMNYVPCKNCKP